MKDYFEKHQIELGNIINELNEQLDIHKQDFNPFTIKYIQKTVMYLSKAKTMLGNIDFAVGSSIKDS